jgi:polar amino acid transport system substrate-binding protein
MRKFFIFRAGAVLMALVAVWAWTGIAHAKEPALLDRIVAKGEIRCAYIPWIPMTIKDPNTGKLSGVFTDVLEKIGASVGLKIVWTEEVSYGTAIEGLKTGRYDMVGSLIWPNTNRALFASFTTPLNYTAVEVFVRTDETRIKTIDDINKPDVAISTIDGESADTIARHDFPQARRVSMAPNTDPDQTMLELSGRKADVVLTNLTRAMAWMSHNPGKIKRLAPGKPLRIFANGYMVPKGEESFREFLNRAIEELINAGYVRQVMKKYELDEGTYPVALPYKAQ